MGGIGKTALAVEAAYRSRAWFPGGFLFVDLRGYDENPVTADQAVLALLDALGVRGTDLPPTAARQYDTYRVRLEQRRRTLLILDNASDAAQFLPLLPGTGHHGVLITSRNRPDALPVRLVELGTLSPDDAALLVTHALNEADERDERPSTEPDALHELTALCGHLPLALQIAAAMLRRRRHRTIASLVSEIKEAEDPAAVLDNGSRGTDIYGRSLVLRPVLETSYRRLPPDQARLLRLLALAPGAETGTEAVAAMAGLEAEDALPLLEDLAATHLVTPARRTSHPASTVRWRMHDLVRAFAAVTVAADADLREEGETARERALRFYHRWARAADDRLRWLHGMPEPERFADRSQALAWLDEERSALVAAAQWAREERHMGTAVQLTLCLPMYLAWRRYFDDWITVARTAQKATQGTLNRQAEAVVLDCLGVALRRAGRTEEAIAAHVQARDLFRAAGYPRGEAASWNHLGLALRRAGRMEEAIDAHIRARALYQVVEERRGEAMSWSNLGSALRAAGRLDAAIDAQRHARKLLRAIADRHGEALASNNLGSALHAADRTEEAIEAYSAAIETYRTFGDWYRAAETLANLARAHATAGDRAAARTAWSQAAEAYRRAEASAEAAIAQASAEETDRRNR